MKTKILIGAPRAHSVMRCMTVGPDKGETEGREPRATVFVLKTSWYEVPTGGPRASGYRPTCSVLRCNPRQDKWSVWSLSGKKKAIQTLKQARAALQEPSSNFSSKTSFTELDIHICRLLKHKLTPLKIKTSKMRAWNQQPLLSTVANTVPSQHAGQRANLRCVLGGVSNSVVSSFQFFIQSLGISVGVCCPPAAQTHTARTDSTTQASPH